MMYERHKVIAVRKVPWDGLWHVMYYARDYWTRKLKMTWDRVPRNVALKVAKGLI